MSEKKSTNSPPTPRPAAERDEPLHVSRPSQRVGGFDVGQFADHSVLSILEPEEGPDTTCWVVTAVHQLPLRIPLRQQVRLLQPHLDTLTDLAVDAGGSGQGVPELITGPRVVPMVIVGGTSKGRVTKGRVTVGKTALIQGMMQMLFHQELRVAPSAPGRDLLRQEMQAFEYHPDGRFRKMEARRGQHDDAVMSVALAAFLARRV